MKNNEEGSRNSITNKWHRYMQIVLFNIVTCSSSSVAIVKEYHFHPQLRIYSSSQQTLAEKYE